MVGSGAGPLLSLEQGKPSPSSPGAQSRLVSLRPQQAPLGHRGHHWHHRLGLQTLKARKRWCSLSPSGTWQETGGTCGHPPSGGSSAVPASSSFLTLPPPILPALHRREAAPGSYRSERRRQRQLSRQRGRRQRQELRVSGVVEGEEALRPSLCTTPWWVWVCTGDLGSRAAQRSGPGPCGRRGSQARALYVARPGNRPPRATSWHPAPDSGPFTPPAGPVPSPRGGWPVPARQGPALLRRPERETRSPACGARRSRAPRRARKGAPLPRRPEGTHSGWRGTDPHPISS